MAGALERFGKLTVQSIGTHSGKFHCDEVLAVALLRFLPECGQSRLIRSRDQNVLSTCDVVVDVGGVYDPTSHRYDHHQRDFSESRHSLTAGEKHSTTKLSSAGLVYHHFGRDALRCLFDARRNRSLSTEHLETLYDQVYVDFVEEVDAIDNGIEQYDTAAMSDARPRYCINSNISQRVAYMNRAWNEAIHENASDTSDDDMRRFVKAVDLVRQEFCDCVFRLHDVWLPARDLVEQCWSLRFQLHASGRIMELPSGAVPWKEHLFQLESRSKNDGEPLAHFSVYPDTSSSVEQWRVHAIPPQASSFGMRTPLLSSWRGLREQELSAIAGLKDCVFVHSSGFIGGARSKETAVQMAVVSLKSSGAV